MEEEREALEAVYDTDFEASMLLTRRDVSRHVQRSYRFGPARMLFC